RSRTAKNRTSPLFSSTRKRANKLQTRDLLRACRSPEASRRARQIAQVAISPLHLLNFSRSGIVLSPSQIRQSQTTLSRLFQFSSCRRHAQRRFDICCCLRHFCPVGSGAGSEPCRARP